MEAFAAPAETPPALLPAAFVDAVLASRPVRDPGGQPGAVVVLVEIVVQGEGAG